MVKMIILGFGALFIINGCSAKGKVFTNFKKTEKDLGIVYFYRPSSIKGYLVNYSIFDKKTNKILGNLKNGAYFSIKMREGIHRIGTGTNSIEIEIKKDSITCIKVYADLDFILRVNLPYIALHKVSLNTCKDEIIKTRKQLDPKPNL